MSDADEKSVRLPAGPAASRRRWSEAEKRRIVAESYQPGVSVALVARRNDLNANLVFNWRRKFRERGGLPTRLPRERPSPSPASESSRQGPARLAPGAIPAPGSPLPSSPRRCRPSRLQRPFATRSTHSEPSPVDTYPALVATARLRPDSAFAAASCRHATAGTRERPGSLHPAPSRAAAPLSLTSPDHELVLESPLPFRLRTRERATFVAGRSWAETLQFATRATACADPLWTSPPSRAGILIWRAAGLLPRHRCGPVGAANAPPATEPHSGTASRLPERHFEFPAPGPLASRPPRKRCNSDKMMHKAHK